MAKKLKNKKSLTKFQKVFGITTLIALTYLAFPLFLLLFIGFLPSLTALLTSRKNKTQLTTISCFNIASMIPFIQNLCINYSLETATSIVSSVLSLIIIYGFPAFGLFLHNEIPNLTAQIIKIRTKNRLKEIDRQLDKINEEWGGESTLRNLSSK